MNTQRDLKIVTAMGLQIFFKLDNPRDEKWYCLGDKQICKVNNWNPSENPDQFQMIEDWVIEQGYRIAMNRDKNGTWFYIYKEPGIDRLGSDYDSSKSEAFLIAVEQLIDNLKK